MIATIKQLKDNINNEIWILPTGNNKIRSKTEEESLICKKLIKVSSANAIFLGEKIRLNNEWDSFNCSGILFITKEDALNYIWSQKFLFNLRYEQNLKNLSFNDLKQIETIINNSNKGK